MFLEVRALFSDLKNRKNPQNFRFLGMKSTFFRFEKPETFSYFSGNYREKNTGSDAQYFSNHIATFLPTFLVLLKEYNTFSAPRGEPSSSPNKIIC